MATTANASGDGTVTCILAIDWYLSLSAGKGYLQGNYATSTLSQILSFITETASGGTALPANQSSVAGLASPTVGYIVATASAKTPFATDTPTTVVGMNMVTALTAEHPTGIATASKGIVAGGYLAAASALAEKATFASETIALTASANLSAARLLLCGSLNDTNNGYFMGGSGSDDADKCNFATDTTAAVVSANLVAARYGGGGISKPGSFGYITGGFEAAKSSKVDKCLFATDTTVASTALVNQMSMIGGLSGANTGYSCGGSNSSATATGITTAVEGISFVTDTPAVVAGAALPTAQTHPAAISTLN